MASAASAQSQASATFADAEDPVGSGTLSLSQGDQTVTLDLAEGSSLRDVRDAINGSAADIQAVIGPRRRQFPAAPHLQSHRRRG